jgi:peptide/nickel transport system substrate-binding protein
MRHAQIVVSESPDRSDPGRRGLRARRARHAPACFLRSVALVACTVLASTACSRSGAHADDVRSRPLRLGFGFSFASLDPLANDGFAAAALDALVYSYLLRTGPDGHLKPDLSIAVPSLANGGISHDGLTIAYHLRHDVRWHDGAPLTAADVAFTYRAIVNPANVVGSRVPYARLASVRAADRWTVVVRLRAPDASIVGTFFTSDSNYGVLPEHLLGRERELNDIPFDAHPIGSGPYRVVRWERGSQLRLAANPTYFLGKPAIGAIDLRFVPDSSTVLNQLRTGELDGQIEGDLALASQYAALPNHVVSNVPYVGSTFAAFNVERPLVRDPRVRRAIASAIDRAAVARDMYRGAVGADDAARGIFSYADDPRAPWPRFDPRAAARGLDAAGWRLGTDGFRRRGGTLLALVTIFANRSSAERIEAVTIQRELADVGVRADLHAIEGTRFWLPSADGGTIASGRFDLALASYSSDVDPDVSWLLACHERAPIGFNESRYCNPAVDVALAEASRALDPTRRIAALRRVQRIVATDVPFIPLAQLRDVDVLPAGLRGFTANGTLPYDSVARWSWAK